MRINRRFVYGAILVGILAAAIAFTLVNRSRPDVSELERKVGQLILVGFDGTNTHDNGVRAVSAQLADGKIGGVTIMGRNVGTARQFKDLTSHLRAQAQDVFIAIDQEGGRVQRMAGLTGVSSWVAPADMPDFSGNCDPDISTQYYARVAAQLPEFNINLNFGPVVDLNINPDNPVIGRLDRSYSANADIVARCAEAFIRGHQVAGVLTSLKHFPGHGSATEDSHRVLPHIETVWQESELAPYRMLAKDNLTDIVMMAHVVHSRFSDAPDLPASLSRKGVAAAREIVGDEAVILTDCLEMDAISRRFTSEEAAVRALEAGNDMVMLTSYGRFDPGLGDRINAAIVEAVEDGRLSLDQLERSIERIRTLKSRI